MENILKKVNFEKYDVYDIQIKIGESFMFEGISTPNDDGEDMDSVSQVRRTIKYSTPFDNKKIIKSIELEEKEDKDGIACRDIELQYYLLVEKVEDDEEFLTEELHDDLEEEWRDGSSNCEILIQRASS